MGIEMHVTLWFDIPHAICLLSFIHHTLQWHHNGRGSVSNHQHRDCLLNRLFRRTSKKTSKLRVTGLCAGNSPGTGEFSAQMASNAENVSIWWRHHVTVGNFSCYIRRWASPWTSSALLKNVDSQFNILNSLLNKRQSFFFVAHRYDLYVIALPQDIIFLVFNAKKQQHYLSF